MTIPEEYADALDMMYEAAMGSANEIDPACRKLVKAMNLFPGIRTIESCCGHQKYPYHIWFLATDLDALPQLLYWFDSCHCGLRGWSVMATTDCAMSPVVFRVEGPIGDYEGSEKIAKLMTEYAQEQTEAAEEENLWYQEHKRL